MLKIISESRTQIFRFHYKNSEKTPRSSSYYQKQVHRFFIELHSSDSRGINTSSDSAPETESMQVDNTRKRPRIVLAACGSVDAIKFKSLCQGFSEWAEVRAVATRAALVFIDRASLPNNVFLYIDDDDWTNWRRIGDKVLHIQLCNWAEVLVIAPLSANTLGKIAGGLCDNLLTCMVRAWDYKKPFYAAPAMSALMWNSSLTEKHLMSVDDLGITLIRPKSTSREQCDGVMAEPSLITSTVRMVIESQQRKNKTKLLH